MPIAIAVEEWRWHEGSVLLVEEESARKLLAEFSAEYLDQVMRAGRIDAKFETLYPIDGGWCLTGKYACYEMIGKSRLEENLLDYEAG